MDWWSDSYNWVSGCTRVTEACDHCWVPNYLTMMTLDKSKYAGAIREGSSDWSGVVQVLGATQDRDLPVGWTTPRWVFINIMSDTFHKDVPIDNIIHQLALTALLPQHIWMLCTKRERRMREILGADSTLRLMIAEIERLSETPRMARALRRGRATLPDQLHWPLPNLWAGVTLEKNKYRFRVEKILADTPAVVRFASCEPLMDGLDDLDTGVLDWMVVGGEDLPPDQSGYRPIHPEWARSLRDRCAASGTAFWFKQWGSGYPVRQGGRNGKIYNDTTPTARDLWLDPNGTQHAQPTPTSVQIRRMHKRSAWRLLDGIEQFEVPPGWDQHPAVVAHAQHHGVKIGTPRSAM